MSNHIKAWRERLALSREKLAASVEADVSIVDQWEAGLSEPSLVQAMRIARALNVPTEAISRASRPPSSDMPLLYRADLRAGALSEDDLWLLSRRIQDYAYVERAVGATPWLPESYPLREFNDDTKPAIEDAAKRLRATLGFGGAAPFGDAFDLLEKQGLKIIRAILPNGVFGASAYADSTAGHRGWGATVFVSDRGLEQGKVYKIPYERQVFTVLHEVAHLIFHREDYTCAEASNVLIPLKPRSRGDQREKIADYFAGAVLLPREAMESELRSHPKTKFIPLHTLKDMKLRYGASMGTIVRRAEHLELISKKVAGVQLGRFKSNPKSFKGEPVSPSRQPRRTTPRLEELVLRGVMSERIGYSRAAEILGCSLPELDSRLSEWAGDEFYDEVLQA